MTEITPRRARNQAPKASGRHPAQREQAALALDRRFDAATLSALRAAVIAHASVLVPASLAEEMVLVAHELATNAVRHGGGRGRLRLWATDGRLCCAVSDSGPGLANPSLAGAVLPTPKSPGGRGLWIARQMADLTIESSRLGTTVTAAMPRRAAGPEAVAVPEPAAVPS